MSRTNSNTKGYQAFQEFNADFLQRVVVNPEDHNWHDTGSDGIYYCMLEACFIPYSRRTLILNCKPGSILKRQDAKSEVEFIVMDGEVTDDQGCYTKGTYVRNPGGSSYAQSRMGCTLFVKLSQIHEDDQSRRVIDTNRESKWLPGPEEHTEIYPLHMWDTESVFLIRWTATASVKPTLNPVGEELLVLAGTLRDQYGSYKTGSWIRNPAKAWQDWTADEGTIVYYKSGHYPKESNEADHPKPSE